MTDREHISQEDLALFAMQALSSEETAAVRAHLASCAHCRAELAELSGDLALVGLAVEQHPLPEGARQHFIDRVSTDTPKVAKSALVPIPATGQKRRGAAVWIPWAVAAALVIAVISLNMKINSLNKELRNQSDLAAKLELKTSRAQEVLDVITAPSAQRVTLTASKTPVVPTGRAVYLSERGALIFQANNLERLPKNKTYELWVIPANGKAPIPAGIFRPDAAGSASVVLPPLPKGIPAKAFGVTVEKAEGSDTPTAPIVLSGAASAPGE
jgi:hypothetical protein